jgi:predicted nucleotide-binding protein
MRPEDELLELAAKLRTTAAGIDDERISKPIERLEVAAQQVDRAFSGSWLGYHSRVYYDGLTPPPPGASFSQEWGLKDGYGRHGTRGDWREYNPDDVLKRVQELADNPDLSFAERTAKIAAIEFRNGSAEVGIILAAELAVKGDPFLAKLRDELDNVRIVSAKQAEAEMAPAGQLITRDTLALGQGTQVPPHFEAFGKVVALRVPFQACERLAEIALKAGSYLERKNRKDALAQRVGTNVFIGHGQSAAWRELKDFVADRLKLPWDEFNRVPIAGVTNIARLSEMLDAAAVALLVLTAEDEMADGGIQARMNVVHEAGLFQGRLSFTKALVLLEEGCMEFSNIQGLGQIRFQKGKISTAFEEVRRVLEREGLIPE